MKLRKVDFFNILTKVEIYTKWEGGGGVWGCGVGVGVCGVGVCGGVGG